MQGQRSLLLLSWLHQSFPRVKSLLYRGSIHFPHELLDDKMRQGEGRIFQLPWMNSQGRRDKDLLWSRPHQSSPGLLITSNRNDV